MATTRSSATFKITTDKLGFIYYVIANRYMRNPNFLNVKG